MKVRGSRVAVIGGSIAGCAVAIALERLGCDAHVFERSSGALRDRGSGIAIPLALRDELIDAAYLPADYPSCRPVRRHWVHRGAEGTSVLLWDQPSAAALSNWGVLWRSLRTGVPDERYHDGRPVASVRQGLPSGDRGAEVAFADGYEETFDVVIGADGYGSAVRQSLVNDVSPEYAGYILWRGNFPEGELTDPAPLRELDQASAWLTVCFAGGHGVMYPIPDFGEGRGEPGRRRVNWAIYAPPPADLEIAGVMSIPPGAVTPAHYEQLQDLLDTSFPTVYRPLFASPRGEVSIQPVYDMLVASYVHDRVVLIGDAGTVSRPHTGSGATKAMQDALCIERLGRDHDDWDTLLAAYDEDRVATGRSLVELGRRIGRDQVEQTPPWTTMSPADFEAWTADSLSGEKLYFYGDSDAR